jgi:hypothetical protein
MVTICNHGNIGNDQIKGTYVLLYSVILCSILNEVRLRQQIIVKTLQY